MALSSAFGSAGKSTIATNLALLLAENAPTLLIDADLAGSSCANLLGVAELTSGTAAALRLAQQQRFDLEALQRLSLTVNRSNLQLLPATGALLIEPTASAIDLLLATASEHFQYLVIDLPAMVQQPFLSSTSKTLIQGFGSASDLALVLALADPVGIQRWLAIEQQLLELVPAAKLVINRLRNSVLSNAKAEISQTLSQLGQLTPLAMLPDDSDQLDRAIRRALPAARSSALISRLSSLISQEIYGIAGLERRVAKLG